MTSYIRLLTSACRSGVIFSAFLFSSPAFAILGASNLEAYCEETAPRETVIYVDRTILNTSESEWFVTLDSRLMSSLMPRERVTLVQLEPAEGRSKVLWSACYPGLTERHAEEQEGALSNLSGLFSSNPERELKKSRDFFRGQLQANVGTIYKDVTAASVDLDETKPPAKSYVRALASDAPRLSQSKANKRLIIYADMLEHSDLASVFSGSKLSEKGVSLPGQLQFDFGDAAIHVFGVGTSVGGASATVDRAESFWRNLAAHSRAALASFAYELQMPLRAPLDVDSFNASLDLSAFGGEKLTGKVILMRDDEGVLQDSMLRVEPYGAVALAGTYVCASQTSCDLRGKLSKSLMFDGEGQEEFVLSGKPGALSGNIFISNASTPDGGKAVIPVEIMKN